MPMTMEHPQADVDERSAIEQCTTEADRPWLAAELHQPNPEVHQQSAERLRALIEVLDDLA